MNKLVMFAICFFTVFVHNSPAASSNLINPIFFTTAYVADISQPKIIRPFDIKDSDFPGIFKQTQYFDIKSEHINDFVWIQKKAPLRSIKFQYKNICLGSAEECKNSDDFYLTFKVIVNVVNEIDGQKSKLAELHFKRCSPEENIELEYGKKYTIEIYLEDNDNNKKLVKSMRGFDLTEQGLDIIKPLQILTYQGRSLKVEYYSGPSISPVSGYGDYSFGWSNGITFTYSNSSPMTRLLCPRLLVMNNLVITDPNSENQTTVETSRLLNIGLGVTWLDAFSIGYVFYFQDLSDIRGFLGIDFFKFLNTFL